MSPFAVLLRVLLALALVLNGSVPAAHAAMGQGVPVAPASGHEAGMAMPAGHGCHETPGNDAGDAAPASVPVRDMPDDGVPDDDMSGDGVPFAPDGCCGDGDCRSACAQHCAVSMPAITMPDLIAPLAAAPLPQRVAAHADPRLRDRIRPPIA